MMVSIQLLFLIFIGLFLGVRTIVFFLTASPRWWETTTIDSGLTTLKVLR